MTGDMSWLQDHIREVPDFPEPGIVFKDLTPLQADPKAFRATVEALSGAIDAADRPGRPVTKIVGVEARGFTYAAAAAYQLGKGLVPVRKPGKLPWEAVVETYDLEYGTDSLEIHRDAISPGENVYIVDDVLATGGTAAATGRLVGSLGGAVAGFGFVVELGFLQGRAKLTDYDVYSIMTL
jgi:adenine phosphoribosyltransferase